MNEINVKIKEETLEMIATFFGCFSALHIFCPGALLKTKVYSGRQHVLSINTNKYYKRKFYLFKKKIIGFACENYW